MPRIVACGARSEAIKDFCKVCKNNEDSMLLVDSETIVTDTDNPLSHLRNQLKAKKITFPSSVDDSKCGLMATCMETWLLADSCALEKYYGMTIDNKYLDQIESWDTDRVLSFLKTETKKSSKGSYDKGCDSFKILRLVDPSAVMKKCRRARDFIKKLEKRMAR